jgi:hypothetical protein
VDGTETQDSHDAASDNRGLREIAGLISSLSLPECAGPANDNDGGAVNNENFLFDFGAVTQAINPLGTGIALELGDAQRAVGMYDIRLI